MSRSPYLHALELLAASRSGASRAPVFGVTEERGPGGIVVPLLRAEIPVCDEWPTAEDAFMATVEFEQRWNRIFREYPVGGAVSPQDAPDGLDSAAVAPKARRRAAVTA